MRFIRKAAAASALILAVGAGLPIAVSTAGAHAPVPDPIDRQEAAAAGVAVDPDVEIEQARAQIETTVQDIKDLTGALEECSVDYCVATITGQLDHLRADLSGSLGALGVCDVNECVTQIGASIDAAKQSFAAHSGPIESCSVDYCVNVVQDAVRNALDGSRASGTAACPTFGCIDVDGMVSAILTAAEWWVADAQTAVCGSNCLQPVLDRVVPLVDRFCVDEGCADAVVDAAAAAITDEARNFAVCHLNCFYPLLGVANMATDMYAVLDGLKHQTRQTACSSARAQALTIQQSADAGYAVTASQLSAAGAVFSGMSRSEATAGALASRALTGTVTSEGGGPFTTGFVVLTLWPGPYMLGQVGHPVLDTAPLDSNGAFRLDPLVPPEVLDAAETNGGSVTATITVVSDTVSGSLTLPFELVQVPNEIPYLTTATPEVPIAMSMRPGAFGVYCTANGDPRPTGDPSSGEPSGGSSGSGSGTSSDPGPTASDSSQQHSRCLPAHYRHEHWRSTITGEVNTSYDMTARYAYGYQRHHDSTISFMVKPPGSGWQMGGSSDRHQRTGFEAVTPVIGDSQTQQMVMVLRWVHEGDYRWESGSRKGQSCSDSEQAYPDGFRGDLTTQTTPHDEGASQNNRCKEYDQGHRIKMQAGSTQRRFENHAHTFGWAGTWMETGYSARSGFSEDVWTRWRAGNNRDRYWLCGRGPSGFANWKRVFAGPTENL